jgi:transposase/AcrR family transcriptional regulator
VLLEALIELGYHGATVRILADRAGLTVPGLYYHYPSKAEILADLLHVSIDDLLHRSELALADAHSPRQRISLQIENAVLFMTYRCKQRQLTSREATNLPENHRSAYFEKRRRFEQRFEEAIADGASEGVFAHDVPSRAARAVLDMCAGVALWYNESHDQTPESIAAQYTKYGLGLLGATPNGDEDADESSACLLNRGAKVDHGGQVTRSGVISDGLWEILAEVMPTSSPRRGRPWNDHRATLEAICWRFRTGSPWRDIPDEFGSWQSIWERHKRWSKDGTYEAIFHAVHATSDIDDDALAALTSISSTSVRHQHAAGAPAAKSTEG